MFKYLRQSLVLTIITIILFGAAYPALLWGIGKLMPERSLGSPVESNGKIIGFENIGQNFSDDKYFWGRPSAVNYNAGSSGASNKSTTNPEYLADVSAKIDSFMVHNPGIKKEEIPSELVTYSGSGLDPNISVQAAMIQIPRVAKARNMKPETLRLLVETSIQKAILGIETINVLKLNTELEKINNKGSN